jgi:hypothetical protein
MNHTEIKDGGLHSSGSKNDSLAGLFSFTHHEISLVFISVRG